MPHRTDAFFSLFVASLSLGIVGCGYTQQSRFQMSFLPAAPKGVVLAAEVTQPPVLQPNIYLNEAPKFLSPSTVVPRISTRSDELARRAEQRFQRGKKAYQAKDTERARQEFDNAIDLMLEASEANPADRQQFDRKFDQMVDSIHHMDMAGLGAAMNVEQASFEKAPLEDILEMTFPVDPNLKDRVREQIRATASQLPLSENDSVLGYIHYFSGRGHRTLITGLQRMGRYKPMIQRILDEEGVPPELIHLAQAESGFMPRAVSRARATGMWQFVAWRGNQYGLKQTPYFDNRLDPEKATRSAARHLRDLYNEFGDWYLAIAAYNCGPGVIERAVERTGYADFWELRARGVIPTETTNYVPIILAMTIMDKNAREYGIDNVTADAPIEYDTIEITSPTHLALIADLTDTAVPELMSLNPALLKSIAPAGYSLRIPKGSSNMLVAALQMIPAERRASWRIHKVESGETLAAIGKRYGAAPSSIAEANHLELDVPVAGDRLIIPAAVKQTVAVKRPVVRGGTSAARRRGTARKASTPAGKRPAVLSRTASNRGPVSGSSN